jgi:uncharacterized protein (TIGR03437 family)
VYATGQGASLLDATTRELRRLPSGVPAPGDALYITSLNPTVTIGGAPATLTFSGLAPGLVGVWQLNVQIPANAPTGGAVPLVVGASNTTTIAVN